eukprot:m.22035 g.22035  ORF g.22035 m.22035 type:complete len:302 (+) comp8216_c0_seq1:157-1062(+)
MFAEANPQPPPFCALEQPCRIVDTFVPELNVRVTIRDMCWNIRREVLACVSGAQYEPNIIEFSLPAPGAPRRLPRVLAVSTTDALVRGCLSIAACPESGDYFVLLDGKMNVARVSATNGVILWETSTHSAKGGLLVLPHSPPQVLSVVDSNSVKLQLLDAGSGEVVRTVQYEGLQRLPNRARFARSPRTGHIFMLNPSYSCVHELDPDLTIRGVLQADEEPRGLAVSAAGHVLVADRAACVVALHSEDFLIEYSTISQPQCVVSLPRDGIVVSCTHEPADLDDVTEETGCSELYWYPARSL